MKTIIALLALVPMMAFAKSSTPKGFTDDLDGAFAAAKRNGKLVLVCFSGSDWCGWCKKLEREVFSHREFLDGTTNDFELVFIDNPQDKSVLSERAKKNNEALTEKYDIHGFPTVLVFTGDGDKVATTGYEEGGPEKYAKKLMSLRGDAAALAKRAKEESAFMGPYQEREKAILGALQREMTALMKSPVARARADIDRLVKDFESARPPKGLEEKHREFLEELHELQRQLRQDD